MASTENARRPIILGITGASGSLYGLRLAEEILLSGRKLILLISPAGAMVIREETGRPWAEWREELAGRGSLECPGLDDWHHSAASGSALSAGMIIAPCSMGSLGRIAAGISGNLLERAADVCLKERRPLILLARETPLSTIHLENMLRLSRAGAVIMPPVPAFYTHPKNLEEMVSHTCHRVLDLLNLDTGEAYRWGANRESHG